MSLRRVAESSHGVGTTTALGGRSEATPAPSARDDADGDEADDADSDEAGPDPTAERGDPNTAGQNSADDYRYQQARLGGVRTDSAVTIMLQCSLPEQPPRS